MKISRLILISSLGAILFGVLYKNSALKKLVGFAPSSGSTVAVPMALGVAPSSARPQPANLPVAHPAPAAEPFPARIFGSAFNFLKHGSTANAANRTTCQRAELRIARGLVVDQLPVGLVMECGGWVVESYPHKILYAGDGLGMNPIYANRVDANEQFKFGRLMTVENGAMRESFSVFNRTMWTPEKYVYGHALLKNYPPGSPGEGKGLKIVVAPDGTAVWNGKPIPAYTATFALTD